MNKDMSPDDFNRMLSHNFNLEIDSWSGRSNDMTDIDTNSIYKQLEDIKSKELNYKANNKDFSKQLNKAVRFIGELRAKYDDNIMLKNEIAQISNASELHGNNWESFKLSPAGQDVAAIMGGKIPARLENDILGYDVDGIFMSKFDIRKMINNTVIDKSSKDVLNGMVEYYKTQAYRDGAGEPNVNEIRGKISNEIVGKGNIQSLVRDKMIDSSEGGSFEQDTINNMLSLTRGDLGATQDTDKSISVEEAIMMYNELSKDEDLKKEQLTDYFTSHVVAEYENERQQNPRANYMNNLQAQQDVLAQATKYEKGSL